jgi:hypothetical protein
MNSRRATLSAGGIRQTLAGISITSIARQHKAKEKTVKNMSKHCLNCGSKAVSTLSDVVPPVFRMDVVQFACGAVLKSVTGAHGRIGRLSHEGCTQEPLEMAS